MIPCASQAQQSGMRQAALHYRSQVHVRQYITSSSGDYSCILLGTGQKYELAQTRELFSIFSEQLFKRPEGKPSAAFPNEQVSILGCCRYLRVWKNSKTHQRNTCKCVFIDGDAVQMYLPFWQVRL